MEANPVNIRRNRLAEVYILLLEAAEKNNEGTTKNVSKEKARRGESAGNPGQNPTKEKQV